MIEKDASQRPYFPGLDFLRFFAAFMVLFGHSVVGGYLNLPKPMLNLISVFCYGAHWVSLFFVLSGFLLGYLAYKDLINNQFDFKKFIVRRVLRIWPLYFAGIAIAYGIFPIIADVFLGKEFTYTSLPYFLFFVGNFAVKVMYELNDFSYVPPSATVLWSVCIEEQFYLLLAFFSVVFKPKYLKYIFSLLCVVGIGFIFLSWGSKEAFYFHSAYYLYDFFAGAILGVVFASNPLLFNNLKNHSWKILLFVAICFTSIGLLNYYLVSKLLLVICSLTVIVYFTVCDDRFTKFVTRNKWLLYGGKISFGIYVYHRLFIVVFGFFIKKYFFLYTQFTKDIMLLLPTLIFTILLSHLSYKYFEVYFLKLKSKFY